MKEELLFEIKKINLRNNSAKKNTKLLPSAFLFTDRNKISNFAEVISNLPKKSAIIIREYDLKPELREKFAQEILQLARKFNHQVLVGKDFNLARKIRADGIHFSDYEKLPIQFMQKKSFVKKFIFSFACHNIKSFLRIIKSNPDIVFISPIFKSSSHPEKKPLGISHIRKIRKLFSKSKKMTPSTKIYGLGGIAIQNLQEIRKSKVSGFGAIDIFLKNSCNS